MALSTNTKKITEEKVWMKYYSEEAKTQELPQRKAFDYVMEINGDRLDQPALHYFGRNISFLELNKRVNKAAKAFVALGVKEGDIVSFLSVSVPETIASVYALNKIGAAANTIDPRLDIKSIEKMIKDSGSKILVAIDVAFPKVKMIMDNINQEKIIVQSPADSLPAVKRILKKLTTKNNIPYSDTIITWKQFIAGGKKTYYMEAPYKGDALVAITYTGGTTGIPKGVMITNDSMNAVGMNFIHCDVHREDNDRFLGIIPIFSAYGMVCGMHMPLCIRMTLVPIPKFIPNEIGKLVKTFRPNHVISTPVFIELLIGSREVENMDLSFLYTLASGGDSMNEGLENKLNEFRKEHNMRFPLAQGYGMSELSAAASFCVNRIYKQGSVGVPSLNVNVGIFDPETGEELGYNQNGEVCVTGPTMMKGYFNNPEETAYVMRKHDDGQVWIHSGDVGYMDTDGFLFIKGRIKRMITRFDGHKVFPINMESLIANRKDVHNCAVVGVNDCEHSQGQYPLALVELMPGVSAAACKKIYDDCHEQLEERGRPVAVLAVEKLPLTPMGKIDYRALEKEYGKYQYTKWDPAVG
ncbi:MAG: acyl--CoA ligase [Oscillospiraceae bacterium]|nr:acyl--CoA ligase [Oscillospiraceae bacterium]